MGGGGVQILLKSARCSWPAAFLAIATCGAAPLSGFGAGGEFCAHRLTPSVNRTSNIEMHAFMTTSCARSIQTPSHKSQVTRHKNKNHEEHEDSSISVCAL